MQSVLVYGRHLARAVLGYIPYDASSSIEYHGQRKTRRMRLMTASCGFSKGVTPPLNANAHNVNAAAAVFNKKGIFGDDACFVARYKTQDVLGKFILYCDFFL